MNILKWLGSWRYRYFLNKLRGVKKMMCDLEFKRYKTREIREEIRQEYDSMRSRLQVAETQIEAQKKEKTTNEDERKRLEDQVVLLGRDSDRLVAQMKQLDAEIDGSKATNEYPEGVQGIAQQLDALRELEAMIRDYIK